MLFLLHRCHVTMPKLTEEGYRVNFVHLTSTKIEDFVPYDIVGHCYNLFEIKLLNDVTIGDIYIIDMSNYTFSHISRITPVHLKKIFLTTEVRLLVYQE